MARHYDYSQVSGIQNRWLRALAAIAVVASPVIGVIVFVVLFALAYTVGR